jgi:hypothetical protein
VNISGTWLGTYWQKGQPTRFEATFVQGNNALSGSILDENNLGEAQLSGEVIGRSIRFTKRYLTSSPIPIDYGGSINDEENFMSGTWQLELPAKEGGRPRKLSGTWEAHRSDQDLMADLKNRLTQQIPVGANS